MVTQTCGIIEVTPLRLQHIGPRTLVLPSMFRSSWIIFSIVSPTVSFILRPSSALICQPTRRLLYSGYVGYYRSESSSFLRSNHRNIARRNQQLWEAHQRKRTPGFGRQMTSDETDPTIEEDAAVPAKSTTRTRTRSSTAVDASSKKGQATPPAADDNKAGPKKRKTSKVDKEADTTDTEKAPRKKKAPTHQVQTERDDIPKLWDTEKAAESGSYSKFACSCYMIFHPLPLNSTTTASRITSLQDRFVECCWNQGDAKKFAERIP
jgi:hypothetical protein